MRLPAALRPMKTAAWLRLNCARGFHGLVSRGQRLVGLLGIPQQNVSGWCQAALTQLRVALPQDELLPECQVCRCRSHGWCRCRSRYRSGHRHRNRC